MLSRGENNFNFTGGLLFVSLWADDLSRVEEAYTAILRTRITQLRRPIESPLAVSTLFRARYRLRQVPIPEQRGSG